MVSEPQLQCRAGIKFGCLAKGIFTKQTSCSRSLSTHCGGPSNTRYFQVVLTQWREKRINIVREDLSLPRRCRWRSGLLLLQLQCDAVRHTHAHTHTPHTHAHSFLMCVRLATVMRGSEDAGNLSLQVHTQVHDTHTHTHTHAHTHFVLALSTGPRLIRNLKSGEVSSNQTMQQECQRQGQ